MCALAVNIPSGEDEPRRIEGRIVNVLLRGFEVIASPFSVTGYVCPVGDARHLIQLTHRGFAGNSSVISLHIDTIQIGDRLDVPRVIVVDLSVVSDSFPSNFGHAFVGRGMLLGLPVGSGVVRQGVDVLIEFILSRLVLKVNVIPPFILGASSIIVGKNVVPILTGQIT